MTMNTKAPAADSLPWREWARLNAIGLNRTQRAISEGKLKVRRLGRKMIILRSDGLRFLESLPVGPNDLPENFKHK